MSEENNFLNITKEEEEALKKRFLSGASEVSHGSERVRLWTPEQYMTVLDRVERRKRAGKKYRSFRIRSRSGF